VHCVNRLGVRRNLRVGKQRVGVQLTGGSRVCPFSTASRPTLRPAQLSI